MALGEEGKSVAELAHLLPGGWEQQYVKWWLDEDVAIFDVGGYVVGNRPVSAQLLCKSPGVLAGRPFFEAIFRYLGCGVEWFWEEGAEVGLAEVGKAVAMVSGPAHRVLQGERPALNLIARLSGIATGAARAVAEARKAGFAGSIAGSRKTTPGLRMMEKYALLVGGAEPHRLNLSTSVMLKDNHVDLVGSIGGAIRKARGAAGFTQKIEVEARSVEQALEAASEGADIVMLDNFEPLDAKLAAQKIKVRHPSVMVEASGGMDERRLRDYVCPWIDVISMGSALTLNVTSLDFSLKIVK